MENKKRLIVFCGLSAGMCFLVLWHILWSSNSRQGVQPQKAEAVISENAETQHGHVGALNPNVNELLHVGERGPIVPQPAPEAEQSHTFLRNVLAEACDKAGISFRSLARKKHNVEVAVGRRTTLKQVLTQTAVEADLLFIEDAPNGLDEGTCKTVVLTDVAVYAGDNEKVIELLDNMGSDDPEVRSESTESLGDYEKASFEPILRSMLRNDSSPDVRYSAAIALEHAQQPESIDLLIASLSDSDRTVREHARASLGVIRGEYVYERLYEAHAATDDVEVREIIEQILEEVFNAPLFID